MITSIISVLGEIFNTWESSSLEELKIGTKFLRKIRIFSLWEEKTYQF